MWQKCLLNVNYSKAQIKLQRKTQRVELTVAVFIVYPNRIYVYVWFQPSKIETVMANLTQIVKIQMLMQTKN